LIEEILSSISLLNEAVDNGIEEFSNVFSVLNFKSV